MRIPEQLEANSFQVRALTDLAGGPSIKWLIVIPAVRIGHRRQVCKRGWLGFFGFVSGSDNYSDNSHKNHYTPIYQSSVVTEIWHSGRETIRGPCFEKTSEPKGSDTIDNPIITGCFFSEYCEILDINKVMCRCCFGYKAKSAWNLEGVEKRW